MNSTQALAHIGVLLGDAMNCIIANQAAAESGQGMYVSVLPNPSYDALRAVADATVANAAVVAADAERDADIDKLRSELAAAERRIKKLEDSERGLASLSEHLRATIGDKDLYLSVANRERQEYRDAAERRWSLLEEISSVVTDMPVAVAQKLAKELER